MPGTTGHRQNRPVFFCVMSTNPWDTRVRTHAFQWLDEQLERHGDVLPRALLSEGFELDDRRIPLVSPQGIFTPRGCDYPLTITTVLNGPYPDRFEDAHRLSYSYRGMNPQHRDNIGLRNAMRDNVPLIYLFAVATGRYTVIKPVFVTGDDMAGLRFTIMADVAGTFEERLAAPAEVAESESATFRRRYATAAVQRRLHQASFRERVLDAYRTHCAMCRLRHRELLDAAHIIPDIDPEGHPEVSNGLSLCKIHHAAFDHGIIGVRPDYVIEVRRDVLDEVDGPMLKYGLQALHDEKILLPSNKAHRPAVAALERRYELFRM